MGRRSRGSRSGSLLDGQAVNSSHGHDGFGTGCSWPFAHQTLCQTFVCQSHEGEEGVGGLGHGSRGKGLAGGVHGHFKLAHTPFTSVSQRCWQRGTAKVRVARRERGDKGKEVQEPPPSPLPSPARVTLKLKLKLSIVFCRLHWTRGRSLGMQGGAGRSRERRG